MGPRTEGRGDEPPPYGERGSRLAADAEGVLHDARWQAYQSVHAVFYPGVADQVEATVQFAVMLSPWHLVIEKVPEKGVKFTQLLQLTVTSFVDLEDSLAPVAPPSRRSATV
ncbi:hypothetical protein PI125_g788 [Phytophthora idaei]|nr:hypothetical protein PI125_g788 [Phytophthora idaei]